MPRRFAIEWAFPAGLLGLVTWLVWFEHHDLTRSYDYVNILGDHFYFLRESLLRGIIPWWNPFVGLGRPFFTDIHFGTFYPPTYLLLFGERFGSFLFQWFNLVLLFDGTRRLMRDLEINPAIAQVAALFAGLSGCFAARVMMGQILFMATLSWLPWLLLHTMRLNARWNWKTVTGLTVSLSGSLLCGNANTWWVLCVGAGLTFLFREAFEIVNERAETSLPARTWPRVRGRTLQFAAALIFTLGLTAPAWLPYLDLVHNANRMESSYEFANAFTAGPTDLLSLFAAPSVTARFNWERCWFVGALWLFAGLCGATTSRDARLRAIAGTTVFALLYSLGEHTPVHRICFHILPGAAGFRIPSRMAPWAAMGLLTLGASFLSRPEGFRRSIPPVAAGLLTAALGLFAARRLAEDPVDALNFTTCAQLAVGAGVVLFTHRLANRRHLLPALIALVTLLECGVFLLGTKPNYTFEFVMGSPPDFPFTRKLAELRSNLGIQAGQAPPRANLPDDLAPPNAGIRHRVAMLNSDAPLYLERPWRFLHVATGTPESTIYRNTLPDPITTRSAETLPLVTLNVSRSTTDSGFTVTPDSFPRAYFTSSSRAQADEESLLKTLVGGFPFTRGVLVEDVQRPDLGALDTPFKPVPIQLFENDRVLISLTNDAPGYLVLSEAWFPGWTARDGDKRIHAEPVNGWMRGFRLPAGTHRLEIVFRPRHFGLGCLIAFGSLAAFLFSKSRWPDSPSPAQS
jgi:hypothetical protein